MPGKPPRIEPGRVGYSNKEATLFVYPPHFDAHPVFVVLQSNQESASKPMSEAKRMADLYRSVYEGDENGEAWHGRALKPLLKGVSAEQASGVPRPGEHSILQLVLHIAYWEEIVLRRFNGEVVDAPLNTRDDWPANRRLSNAEWQATLTRLDKAHAAMREAIAGASDEKLTQRTPKRDHDNYTLLHGIIHHCVYHSGQIASVKKGWA